jgi:hypothetical protein
MTNKEPVKVLEPTRARPDADRAPVPREWQFSLRSLLLVTTVVSICVAMGTYFVGVAFAAFVLVLLEVVALFSFEWLIRPVNRRLLSFVVTGSWIILGSGMLIVSFSLAYGRLAAGDTSDVWFAIMFIALTAPVCYFVAWRRWKRLTRSDWASE